MRELAEIYLVDIAETIKLLIILLCVFIVLCFCLDRLERWGAGPAGAGEEVVTEYGESRQAENPE